MRVKAARKVWQRKEVWYDGVFKTSFYRVGWSSHCGDFNFF